MNSECSNPFSNTCCHNYCFRPRNCCCNNNTLIPGPPGPQGPAGTAATIAIGTTTTGAPGTNATVINSGTSNNAVLNFSIPRGENGTAATVSIGTTTTLPPGNQATVTNTGTSSNAILNFGIPSGNITTQLASGSFISRSPQTFTVSNSIIELPTTLNSENITINNGIISLTKSGRYMINYGINANTTNNTFGIYINGINNPNTNLETTSSNLSPSTSIILELNTNDTISLGAINTSPTNPLILQANTINAYITITSLD